MFSRRYLLAGLLVACAVLVTIFYLAKRHNVTREENGTGNTPPIAVERSRDPDSLTEALTAPELLADAFAECADAASMDWARDWTEEDFTAHRREVAESLFVSASPEHLYAAAILEDDPARRVSLIAEAVFRNNLDPLVLWGAVQICTEHQEWIPCPLQEWERRLVAVDSQNSEVWARVAANRYARGEYVEALEAMRRASVAAEAHSYWPEIIAMIERGYAAGSSLPFAQRAAMALGAAPLPTYDGIFTMCREQAAQSREWAYTCLAYGQLLERQGRTELSAVMSRAIQRETLQAAGDEERARAVTARIESHRQARIESRDPMDSVTLHLLVTNPAVFSTYLEAIRSEGEMAAVAEVSAMVEEMVQRQPELACE